MSSSSMAETSWKCERGSNNVSMSKKGSQSEVAVFYDNHFGSTWDISIHWEE